MGKRPEGCSHGWLKAKHEFPLLSVCFDKFKFVGMCPFITDWECWLGLWGKLHWGKDRIGKSDWNGEVLTEILIICILGLWQQVGLCVNAVSGKRDSSAECCCESDFMWWMCGKNMYDNKDNSLLPTRVKISLLLIIQDLLSSQKYPERD